LHAGEGGRVAQLGPIAQDRCRAEEGERPRRQASEAKPDGTRYAVSPDFQQAGYVFDARAGSLPRHCVEHRVDKERITSSGRFQGGTERVVRVQTVQLAREHRDRGTPERLRANRARLRIGDELGDQRGIAALALRRPRACGDEEGHSLEPSRQVEEPSQGGGVGPVQVVDGEKRGPVKGHVGRQPVEAVEDRKRALGGSVLRTGELRRSEQRFNERRGP
jgi:hypothetical protein